jgi:uncharacterized protein with NRDE domain
MCTIIGAIGAYPGLPAMLAGTRDEQLGRTARPPFRWPTPQIVAPRDERAGGTWMGASATGLLVALANRWVRVPDGGERSRGQLVVDMLAADGLAHAEQTLASTVEAETYDGFNLLVLDADVGEGLYAEWDGTLRAERLDPGVYVMTNAGRDGQSYPQAPGLPDPAPRARVADALGAEVRDESTASGFTDRVRALLASHDPPVCLHRGDDVGTVSASVFRRTTDGVVTVEHTPGPPCTTAARTLVEQL